MSDVIEVPLTRSKVALISRCDFELIESHKWNAGVTQQGYWYAKCRWPGNKSMKMHRLILGAGPSEQVDHRDGNGLNNTRSNIRISTQNQNMHNRTAMAGSSTPFKGVFWVKKSERYKAQIKFDGKCLYLGEFVDPVDAALAYDTSARIHHGEFACVNFPNDKSERIARIEHSPRDSEGEAIPRLGRAPSKPAVIGLGLRTHIRFLLDSGMTQAAVASECGVGATTVWGIAHGIIPKRFGELIEVTE